MALFIDRPVATAVAVLLTAYIARWIYRLVQWRKRFRNLPGPPHHPIFGHLISMGKVVSKLPKRVHPHAFAHYLTKEYDLPPVFYLDLYPFNDPLMLILDPDVAQQVSTETIMNKHTVLKTVLKPLAGPENMVSSNGMRWKKWRTVFNPGFSVQHLMSQVPLIVDCAVTFADILDRHATRNEVFRMEEDATRVTIDVIGKAVLNHDFGYLLSDDNDFVLSLRRTLAWMPDSQSFNPFHVYNPMRPIMSRYYKYRMDRYIGKVLDEKLSTDDGNRKRKKKTGIDLALLEYYKESGIDPGSGPVTMDAEFRRNAIDQLLILIFAGHDTTASTVCYIYHMLFKHPDKLKKLRQELDDIFGTSGDTAEQLKNNPYLINKAEYTLAVIKETLRLWAPASTVRKGGKNDFIKDPVTGNMLPTVDCVVFPPIVSIQRDPRNFEDAQSFIPERFLPENIDKMKPNAYRPFEKGPRNCIGQELAILEMKIVLALTVREFDIRSAFDELSKLDNDGTLWDEDKSWKTGPQECFGDEMYQVLLAAAKPREGHPARVTRRTKR